MRRTFTAWVEYTLWILLSVLSLQTRAATYYWVGGSGFWDELSRWAASPNGPGFAYSKLPSDTDDVVFTRFSFSSSSQCAVVRSDAFCRSISFDDVQANGLSPTFQINKSLTVSGHFSAPPLLKLVVAGGIFFQAPGNKNINIQSAITGSGGIYFQTVNGIWNLLSDINAASCDLVLNGGTLNTNNRNLTIRRFISTSVNPRVLNLGNSKVQLRCVVLNPNIFWDILNPQTFSLIAGNSEIEFFSTNNASTGGVQVVMRGGGLHYNRVVLNIQNNNSAAATSVVNLTVNENNSFNHFVVTRGNFLLNGSNTFHNTFSIAQGTRQRFAGGLPQYFGPTCNFIVNATQTAPVYLQCNTTSNVARFNRNSGLVCLNNTYISGIVAEGGASWNVAGTVFNLTPILNLGWNFGSGNVPIQVSIVGGTKCKNQPFKIRLQFGSTTYPLTVLIRNENTMVVDTIRNITTSSYDYYVNPSVTTDYRVLRATSSGCFVSTTIYSNLLATVIVPNYGRVAQWVGRKDNNWYDCENWSNYAVPEDTVNVTVAIPIIDSLRPLIAHSTANTQRLEISYDADLTMVGDSTRLNIFGDFVNHGRFHLLGGIVSFIGDDVNRISGGTYTNLTINNTTPLGITLDDTVEITGSLTLNNGIVKTNGNIISINNPSPQAIKNYGSNNYINGPLVRAVSDTGLYAFPVGDDVIYALCMIRPRGSTGGVSKFKVTFIHKQGTDDGLNLQFGNTTINSVHPAGIWLIEPDQQPNFGTGGISGDYELIFDVSGFPGLQDYNFYILTRPDSSTNAADWRLAGIQSGATVQNGRITVSGITHFSQWGIGTGGGSLPVTLAMFKAKPKENKYIHLEWVTASEIDNKGFFVERSTNGVEFASLGFIQGKGNSNETVIYPYDDKNVESNITYYYRLKQVDFDESFEYSKIVTASLDDNNAQEIKIGEFIPNPASSVATLDIISNKACSAEIVLSASSGQKMLESSLHIEPGENNFNINVGDLSEGTYVASIKIGEVIHNRKLVIKR
ncbi:MAG: T9SS type A sorting domain-containing protein [Chitinophagales bacterium]|nr:T9SS type A sorting domain-containing protein [Chitinophagales bacterium]